MPLTWSQNSQTDATAGNLNKFCYLNNKEIVFIVHAHYVRTVVDKKYNENVFKFGYNDEFRITSQWDNAIQLVLLWSKCKTI